MAWLCTHRQYGEHSGWGWATPVAADAMEGLAQGHRRQRCSHMTVGCAEDTRVQTAGHSVGPGLGQSQALTALSVGHGCRARISTGYGQPVSSVSLPRASLTLWMVPPPCPTLPSSCLALSLFSPSRQPPSCLLGNFLSSVVLTTLWCITIQVKRCFVQAAARPSPCHRSFALNHWQQARGWVWHGSDPS